MTRLVSGASLVGTIALPEERASSNALSRHLLRGEGKECQSDRDPLYSPIKRQAASVALEHRRARPNGSGVTPRIQSSMR